MNPLTPYLIYIKIAAAIALVVGLVSGLAMVHHHIDQGGYDRRAGEDAAKEAKIVADAKTQQAKDGIAALKKQTELQAQVDQETAKRLTGEKEHETTVARLERDARDSKRKLYVATHAADPLLAGAAPGDSGAAGGPGAAARSELMPDAAGNIFRVAGGIARLVRDYNAVVKQYNEERAVCNAQDAEILTEQLPGG